MNNDKFNAWLNKGQDKKEIIVVEKIDGESLESFVQTFVDVKDAEKAFSDILKKDFDITNEDDINDYLDDGYFADDTHYSVIIKEVELQI